MVGCTKKTVFWISNFHLSQELTPSPGSIVIFFQTFFTTGTFPHRPPKFGTAKGPWPLIWKNKFWSSRVYDSSFWRSWWVEQLLHNNVYHKTNFYPHKTERCWFLTEFFVWSEMAEESAKMALHIVIVMMYIFQTV